MEKRADLRSILQYLPLVAQSSSLVWPPSVEEELQTMSKGPSESMVNSGEALALHITNMRISLSLNASDLAPYAFQGKYLEKSQLTFLVRLVPGLCELLLQLPSMLEMHYHQADHVLDGVMSGLRLLGPQEAGIVSLSQELIAAVLACSFFCLFPEVDRRIKNLKGINLDELFSVFCLPYGRAGPAFERKILPLEYNPRCVSYPKADYWAKSITPLCSVEVHTSGVIEDQPGEALEVDFADEYFGGLTLRNGCLQEEIRFMINPELIAGMLFLPRMDDNEAIEIVGIERFSLYSGFGSSFQFTGDYADKKELDNFMRRKRRVVAIDAIRQPGMRQYKPDGLLREVNKAFTGYLHQCKHQVDPLPLDSTSRVVESSQLVWCIDHEDKRFGVATGNWGCGVFGGDPELQVMLQWLAISQSGGPFLSYYTFGLQALQNLNQVTERVPLQELTVGDLWNVLVEYSSERLSRRTSLGFFSWLMTSLSA